jgi:hypothetical protein
VLNPNLNLSTYETNESTKCLCAVYFYLYEIQSLRLKVLEMFSRCMISDYIKKKSVEKEAFWDLCLSFYLMLMFDSCLVLFAHRLQRSAGRNKRLPFSLCLFYSMQMFGFCLLLLIPRPNRQKPSWSLSQVRHTTRKLSAGRDVPRIFKGTVA